VAASWQERSRSYLDANCAQSHQPGGSGITSGARYDTPLASQNLTNFNSSVAANALFLVQPLAFSAVGFLPNQQLQLGFLGVTGSNYVLQASTNLTTWTPISTNTATTNATNFPHRFYRVLQP
jgi:hypothetical protein